MGIKHFGTLLAVIISSLSCTSTAQHNKTETPLRIASLYQPGDLHPFSGMHGIEMYQIYRHLVWTKIPHSRKPDLLESYEVSKDGKVCLLHLRKKVLFHNGSLLTAQDVVYSFRRYQKLNSMKSFSTIIVPELSVEEVDRFTVRMRSKVPVEWGFILSNPVLNAEYEKRMEGGSLDEYIPMGTGPYRFVSYDRGKGVIKLSRFKRFRGGPPDIPSIEIHYFPNPEAATMALLENRVDYVINISPGDAAYIKNNPNIELFKTTASRPYQIVLNTDKPFLNDSRVRRALSLLIDRETIVKDLNGGGVAADTSLHMTLPLTKPTTSPADAKTAIKLLADAGWVRNEGTLKRDGKSFRLEILIPKQNSNYLPALRRVISVWENVGISCSFKYLDFTDLWNRGAEGSFDALFLNFTDFLELPSNSMFFKSNSKFNLSRLSNNEVDRIFDRMKTGGMPSLALKKSIQQWMKREAPVIVLFYDRSFGALNKTFKLDSSITDDPYGLYYMASAGR